MDGTRTDCWRKPKQADDAHSTTMITVEKTSYFELTNIHFIYIPRCISDDFVPPILIGILQNSDFSSTSDTTVAPSQWETALLCNAVSDWLSASLMRDWSLLILVVFGGFCTKNNYFECLDQYNGYNIDEVIYNFRKQRVIVHDRVSVIFVKCATCPYQLVGWVKWNVQAAQKIFVVYEWIALIRKKLAVQLQQNK